MADERPSPGEGVPPFALAMVICDAIWRDPGTGKRTLLGCFSTVFAKTFPVRLGQLSIYIAVTDGRGKVPMTLKMVDVDEERPPVFESKGEGVFADPRGILEVDFVVMNAVFPEAGEYRLQLFAGTHPLLERRLLVAKAGESSD